MPLWYPYAGPGSTSVYTPVHDTHRLLMKPSTLRIGKRYRPNRLAPSYDAIVIGSGMGGLTTAALLSELGWKVCVLEQHYTAGGYTHSFERHGYEWDPGVHYIGDVGAETRTRKMFEPLPSQRKPR